VSKKTQEKKPETRKPSLAHADAIRVAEGASLQTQAAVGRAFIDLLNLAGAASRANQDVQGALIKAAMSVGIDPNGSERWSWDPASATYVRQE
jgi:hypothetical protein